jgi:hypothetical protein
MASTLSMQFPSDGRREDLIYKPAIIPCTDPRKSAVFIFVHGLADSAAAIESKCLAWSVQSMMSVLTDS